MVFRAGRGRKSASESTGHTFPLLTHDARRKVGTGRHWFLHLGQWAFVTARHVIDDVLRDGKQIAPLVIAHFYSRSGLFGPGEVALRPIMQSWIDDQADIALGVAATATHTVMGATMENWTWTLDWSDPADGTPADTYAFPNHVRADEKMTFAPNAYAGTIIRSGDYRDSVMVPFPYLRSDISHSRCGQRRSYSVRRSSCGRQLYGVWQNDRSRPRPRLWRTDSLPCSCVLERCDLV